MTQSNGNQKNYRVVKADDWPRVKGIKAEDIAWLDTGESSLVCTPTIDVDCTT
jgi:hypothetical protein